MCCFSLVYYYTANYLCESCMANIAYHQSADYVPGNGYAAVSVAEGEHAG